MTQMYYLSRLLKCADKTLVQNAIWKKLDSISSASTGSHEGIHRSPSSLDTWAENVSLLTSAKGKSVLDAVRLKLDDKQKKAFDRAGNQYSRALWLYYHEPSVFDVAINKCLFTGNQTAFQHSMFFTDRFLDIDINPGVIAEFRRGLEEILVCDLDDIAVDAFEKSMHGRKEDVFYVNIHYNQLQEVFDIVIDGDIHKNPVERANKIVVSYEPHDGVMCVFAEDFHLRKKIGYLFSRCFLGTVLLDRTRYRYQHLSMRSSLPLEDVPVVWARVTELAYAHLGREIIYKISNRDPYDIYAAKENEKIFPPIAGHELTKAKISVRLASDEHRSERNVCIVLKNKFSCSLKAEYLSDRLLCNTLLSQWGIVSRYGSN